jgi:hypothetical protein
VAKNFRQIEESKVGLTDSAPIPNYFDDQAKYADVNARTSWTPVRATPSGQAPAATSGETKFPGGSSSDLASKSPPRVFSDKGAPLSPGNAPLDGLTPETFYTYQIMFIPDMTQKYGLKIKGGVGEIRAAMNLVNGWMFTGLGPYYMKDSSSAQNTLAAGIAANLAASGASDVLTSLAGLNTGRGGRQTELQATQVQEVIERVENLGPRTPPMRLEGYAEIHVYEPHVTSEGQMEWREITNLNFFRDYLGTSRDRLTRIPPSKGDLLPKPMTEAEKKKKEEEDKKNKDDMTKAARQAALEGVRQAALESGGRQAAVSGMPPAGVNQININGMPTSACGPVCVKTHPLLDRLLDCCCKKRPRNVLVEDVREGDDGQVPLPPLMTTTPPALMPRSGTRPALPTPVQVLPNSPMPATPGSSGSEGGGVK